MIRVLAIVGLLVGVPCPALADDKAEAVTLFEQGIRDMKAGNYDQACQALASSLALVPDSGTRGSLARCYTHLGRVASAWQLWRQLAETAPTPQLRKSAATNAAKLEPRLPRYAVQRVAPAKVRATFDGAPIDPGVATPVPVDPGPHVVEVTAEGHVPWRHAFTAVEGKTEEIVIPALQRIAAPQEGAPPVVTTTAVDDGRARKRRNRRRLGLSLVGAGTAFTVGGIAFGAMASTRYDAAHDLCGGAVERCDPARVGEAQDKVDDARWAGNLSTLSFAAGGAVIVTGLVIFLTAPSAEASRVSITPALGDGGAGVVVSGGF